MLWGVSANSLTRFFTILSFVNAFFMLLCFSFSATGGSRTLHYDHRSFPVLHASD
jgi:hypothetical protein